MCQSGEVDVILSSHYDSLLFGCPYLIKDIDMVEGYADVMILQSIYNHFNIDHFQAIDIFILMDTDYNKKISRVGFKTALVKIQSHGKLENTKYYNKKELSINRLRNMQLSLLETTTPLYIILYSPAISLTYLFFVIKRNVSNTASNSSFTEGYKLEKSSKEHHL
uniref:XPG-I domain-containing protein n=1 Tax=Physcomitrium patens TaxID=3218 RepID=A0A7I4ALC5_PHYPA